MRLSDIVFPVSKESVAAELESYRIQYEKENGITDLSRRYTSLLPTDTQRWLMEKYPEHYYSGLPSFVKSFIQKRVADLNSRGQLDDAPAYTIKLVVKGLLDLNSQNRGGRER